MTGTVYLIPSLLAEDGLDSIPPYITRAVQQCEIFFVENERTARRYFKQLWKEMVIDNYQWFMMEENGDARDVSIRAFRQALLAGRTIGIVSEAGCPGVADPGQVLVGVAQEMNAAVKPLTGPSSILLALMASGMNGQQFRFNGYLPIDNSQRIKAIRELENESSKKNCTEIFIETPYRNNQLLEALMAGCQPSTKLCIAVSITGKEEWITTKSIREWKDRLPSIHKKTAIFLLYAGA